MFQILRLKTALGIKKKNLSTISTFRQLKTNAVPILFHSYASIGWNDQNKFSFSSLRRSLASGRIMRLSRGVMGERLTGSKALKVPFSRRLWCWRLSKITLSFSRNDSLSVPASEGVLASGDRTMFVRLLTQSFIQTPLPVLTYMSFFPLILHVSAALYSWRWRQDLTHKRIKSLPGATLERLDSSIIEAHNSLSHRLWFTAPQKSVL